MAVGRTSSRSIVVIWVTLVCCLGTVLVPPPVAASEPAKPQSAPDRETVLAELQRATGKSFEDLVFFTKKIHADFVVELARYVEAYKQTREAAKRETLARDLAKEIYGGGNLAYNVKLRALAEALHRSAEQEILLPVALELAREWHSRRWRRRLVAGGAIVLAGTATVAIIALGGLDFVVSSIGFGLWGITLSGFKAALDIALAVATVDVPLTLLAWWVWRTNPSPVLFPAARDAVHKAVQLGVAVRDDDLALPCLDACAEARESGPAADGYGDLNR